MSKRLFQVLDEMNQHDSENGTALVGVCNQVISADYSHKKGTKVAIGVEGNITGDLMTGKKVCILLVIDYEEYKKRNAE